MVATVVGALVVLALTGGTAAAQQPTVIKVYVVRSPAQNGGRVDTLPDIARRTLGSSGRAGEIFALNRDRAQADGRALTDPARLDPGWILRLPPDASGPDVQLGKIATPDVAGPPGGARDSAAVVVPVALAVTAGVLLILLTVALLARRTVARVGRSIGRRRRALSGRLGRPRRRRRVRAQRRVQGARWRTDRTTPARAAGAAAEITATGGRTDRPGALALRVGEQTVTAWTGPDAEPPQPWHREGPTRWVSSTWGRRPAGPRAGPAMVRVGDVDGDTVFVDLDHCDGTLVVSGHRGTAAEALDALLTETAAARPDLHLLFLGAGSTLPAGLIAADRIDSVDELARRIQPTPLGAAGPRSVRAAARHRPLAGLVVVGPAALSQWDAVRELCCAPGSRWTAVTDSDAPGGHWHWTAEPDGTLTIDILDLPVTTPL